MTNTAPVSRILQAQYRGDLEAVRDLIASGPALDIFEASATGQTARVLALLKEDESLATRHAPDGFFPLALAVFFGHRETAIALLDAGAAVNMHSLESMRITALHSAVAVGRLDLVTLLLSRGADPNARTAGGFTPLHSAAQAGHVAIASALLERGADAMAAADDGQTPGERARAHGKTEVASLLQ
jgi:ankyrin repeat protein